MERPSVDLHFCEAHEEKFTVRSEFHLVSNDAVIDFGRFRRKKLHSLKDAWRLLFVSELNELTKFLEKW